MNKTKACSAGLACGTLVLDLEGERVTEFYGRQKSTLLLTDGLVVMLKCSGGTKALSPAFLSLVGLSSVFQTKTLLLKHCLTFECGTCDTPLGSALSARPDQVSITTQTHSTKKLTFKVEAPVGSGAFQLCEYDIIYRGAPTVQPVWRSRKHSAPSLWETLLLPATLGLANTWAVSSLCISVVKSKLFHEPFRTYSVPKFGPIHVSVPRCHQWSWC